MKRGRSIAVGLVVLAFAGAAAWQLRPADATKKAAGTGGGPVPVRLAVAEQRDLPQRLELTGRTEAYETVTLRSRVEGQILAIAFADGQKVGAGDVLLRLDPADHQARLAQAEANQAKSQAQSAKARADVERYVALKAKGFVSDEKVGEQRNALAAAEAVAKADAAAVDLARLQLSYTAVRAPFDGVVGARLVFPGAAVKANETALVVLNRIRPLNVSFAVPEKYLPLLRTGMGKDRRLKATITAPGHPAGPVEGEVRFLDNAVDVATGTVQLKATVTNADEQLAAGQLVSVSLALQTLRGVVVIPAEAVQQGPDGSFVFLVTGDAADVRKIRIATQQRGMVAVVEGLAAGDRVVVDGQLRLTRGAKVRPAGEKTEGMSGGPREDPRPAS